MDGYGIIVDFDGELLQIAPTNPASATALGARHASIAIDDIISASLKTASIFVNGRLDVTCRDGKDYRLHFRRNQQPSFQTLHKSLIDAISNEHNTSADHSTGHISYAKLPAAAPATITGGTPPIAVLGQGGGYYSQQVAGESHYFRDLAHLVGRARTGEREVTASLQREPGNKYDSNAVKVLIEGRPVGYLPREDALGYQIPLRLVDQMGRLATCKARLWWSREDDDFLASVSLDLADPAQIVPIVWPAASGRRIVLPAGRSYEVRGESDHMDTLTALMDRAYIPGKIAAYGTLHVVERTMPRSKSQIVVIRIEDNEIGELSKQMSARFLPLVLPLQAAGIACYAEVLLTGNAFAVEATVRLTPPEALPQDFVQAMQNELNS